MTYTKEQLIRVARDNTCWDCGGFSNWYMVNQEIWDQAFPDYHTLKSDLIKLRSPYQWACLNLCLPCLEKRLGRVLRYSDFDLSLPINSLLVRGYQMGLEDV